MTAGSSGDAVPGFPGIDGRHLHGVIGDDPHQHRAHFRRSLPGQDATVHECARRLRPRWSQACVPPEIVQPVFVNAVPGETPKSPVTVLPVQVTAEPPRTENPDAVPSAGAVAAHAP